jgi:hypothetical protein
MGEISGIRRECAKNSTAGDGWFVVLRSLSESSFINCAFGASSGTRNQRRQEVVRMGRRREHCRYSG